MQPKSKLIDAAWTVLDQGIVSLGTFLVNVLLARHLSNDDYGTFALLLGGVYTLQVVAGSLVFYPMSVRIAVLPEGKCVQYLGISILLVAFLCIPLCIVFGVVILSFGLKEIVWAALSFLFLSQMQETARKGLLARFRHREAILGDSISYLGQAAILAGIIWHVSLTLKDVFWIMAATSGLAALVQLSQQRITLFPVSGIRHVVRDYWSIGSWSLANNIIWTMRAQLFPWVLAALYGPGQAGLFQAAVNVVSVANPVIIGLCNIIPQTAAKMLMEGRERAWYAVRSYILSGIPPILLYYTAVLIVPEIILRVIYGSSWPSEEVVTALRFLAVAAIMNYVSEMICAYLHGIDQARLALLINTIGTVAVFASALPLTMAFGLVGASAAFTVAAAVRFVSSRLVFTGVMSNEQVRLA